MSKVSHAVMRPAFVIFLSIFMACTAALSGWALTTAWNAKGREIAVARTEAQHAVRASQLAQVQNEQANAKSKAENDKANAKEKEATRLLICKLVGANISDPPPSTPHGVVVTNAWRQIGNLPVLHCGK